MILTYLRLINFRIFEDVELDLSDLKLTSIIGQWVKDRKASNGAGKSYLLEAIPFALYGTNRSKKSRDVVKRGAKTAEVYLRFKLDDVEYQVHRRAGDQSTIRININGKLEASKAGDADKLILERVGVGRDIFELIYFFRQRKQFGFANASPSDRKSYLAQVFDLSTLEKCQETAKKLHTANIKTKQELHGAVYNMEQLIAAKPPINEVQLSVLDACDEVSWEFWKEYEQTAYVKEVREVAADNERMISELCEEYTALRVKVDEQIVLERNTMQQIHHADLEISNVNTKIAQHKVKIEEFKPQAKTDTPIQELEQEIGKVRKTDSDLKAEMSRLQSRISSSRRIVAQASATGGKECPTCYQTVTAEYVGSLSRKVEHQVDLDTKAIDALRKKAIKTSAKVAELEYEKNKRIEDEQKRQFKESLQSDLSTIRRDLKERCSSVVSLKENLLSIQESKRDLTTQANQFGDVLELRKKLLNRNRAFAYVPDECYSLHDRSAKLAEAETNLKHIVQLYKDKEEQIVKLRKFTELSIISGHLVEAFGKNGIQAILIENLVGTIEQFANDILQRMNSPFSIILATQKKIQSGEARETLDIVVGIGADQCMLEDCSGGEQTLINLALRFALSRVISGLHGVKVESIFLDEVLAELDEQNREAVIQVVTYLSKTFAQVFIISHTDQVKDVLPSSLVVERHENYSTVKKVDAQT